MSCVVIGRGTTPLQQFICDIDLSPAVEVYVTYKQGGKVVIEKSIDDITFGDMEISFKLTQEETLKLSTKLYVMVQIRALFPNGEAVKSNEMSASVSDVLKEGVI